MERVQQLRREGKTVRAIAAEPGVHRNRVHRALVSAIPSDSTGRFGDSAFVGRQREMAMLKSSLDLAASGRGQVVTLSGDPGIGKSRTRGQGTTARELDS